MYSAAQDKIADFEMKLIDIDNEYLEITEGECHDIVRIPSPEFARICKDISSIVNTRSSLLYTIGFIYSWFLDFIKDYTNINSRGLCLLATMTYVTKEGMKFSTRGDIGTANVVCRQNM
ncbi:hypothetical protein L1887_24271 [Cichorium endivia]|nr:hypothetical protein L1887_24271 [Cichorium endivia]